MAVADDIRDGPAEGEPLREWVQRVADANDVEVDDLLFQTRESDPHWMGTGTERKQADWAKKWYHRMIDGREGDTIHPRGLHYWMISQEEDIEPPTNYPEWETYEHTNACAQYIGNCLTKARVLGEIPFDAIRDESVEVDQINRISSGRGSSLQADPFDYGNLGSGLKGPKVGRFHLPPRNKDNCAVMAYGDFDGFIESYASEIAKEARISLTIDDNRLRPYYVEVWSEKKVPTEVENVIREYPVSRYIQGSGRMGWTEVHKFKKNVEKAGKPGYILYLSDWDSAGQNMPKEVATKINYFRAEDALSEDVKVDQLAITDEQVEEHDLPQSYDKDEPYVELNALESDISMYCNIVRESLEGLQPPNLEEAIEAEKSRVESIVYQRAKSELEAREDQLRPLYEDAAGVVEEYNDQVDEYDEAYREHLRPIRKRLSRLKSDDRIETLREETLEVPEDIDYPRASVPEVEPKDEPEDPLYDSGRSLIENAERINDW